MEKELFNELQLGGQFSNSDNIIDKLKQTCDKLLLNKKLLSQEQLNQGYNLFLQKFNPTKLKSLDGELLLDTIFNIGNRDGLTYWLEFKNDDKFSTGNYGSIAGGSSFKCIMFKRNLDEKWVTGNPQNPTILSIDEAIELGRELRNALVAGADLINNLSEDAKIHDYIKVQEQLSSVLVNNMHNLGWVHKYYHMLYPNKIDAFHNTKWQKHALICCNIKPEQENKLYTMSGQLMQIIKNTELSSSYIMISMCNLFGSPINYYRIGTSGNNKSYWDDMRQGGYVSIGWPAIGDLRDYEKQGKSDIRNEIKSKLEKNYPNDPRAIGRTASQVSSFYKNINIGDIVVAVDGEKVLGVGRISDSYEFSDGLEFPHIKKTDWIYITETRLPNAREGLRTTVYLYKYIDNIIAIEKLLNTKYIENPTKRSSMPLSPLTGTIAEIESVLSRKKQVILYGPPGTGKTYHAEKTCNELAARRLFRKSFDSLSHDEKTSVLGDGRTNGVVRMCCFHPSYGYEDFIEGIKPRVVNNQTVFEPRDGIFKTICTDAIKDSNKKFYLIIDEINRGDISRIFGELIMLIEAGKRDKEVILPLSNKSFKVPPNVYIVGTMNTADRSIALLDVALRRRFGFIELMPDYTLLENVVFDGLPLAGWLKELNTRICENIGKDARNLQIGHSYFLEKEKAVINNELFKKIIKEDIIPLIEEYCYGDYALISKVLGDGIVDVKNQMIRYELFGSSDISNLVTALLSPCPTLRTGTQTTDNDDAEEENDSEDDRNNGEES